MSEKTIKLYDLNAYDTKFSAEVLSCKKCADEKKGYEVILDKTLFFPEEGGQTPDKGIIFGENDDNGIRVTDVQIKNDIIYHYLERPLAEGTVVSGCIDFEHRFSNMQQHTGEHIFSGIVNARFGYDNVGFHLSDSVVTMDYSGQLSDQELSEIEISVNKAIYENIEVIAEYPSAEVLSETNYRSKKELTGDVRIVTIPGYDVCACCAPHVKRTGEIGILKVISSQNYKGGTRVSILCGQRALVYLASEHEMISRLANELSTAKENIPEQFGKQQQEIADLKRKLSEAGEKILLAEFSKVPSDLEHVCLFADIGSDANVIRRCVNKMTSERDGFCGVFWGNDSEGYRFIIGSGSGRNSNDVLTELKEKFQVRGGGAPAMVQGSMTGATTDDIRDVFRRLNNVDSIAKVIM